VGIITYKWVDMQKDSGVPGTLNAASIDQKRDRVWQTDTSVSNKSWGYIEHDHLQTPEFHRASTVDHS